MEKSGKPSADGRALSRGPPLAMSRTAPLPAAAAAPADATKLEEISSQGIRQIAVGTKHILALSDVRTKQLRGHHVVLHLRVARAQRSSIARDFLSGQSYGRAI